MLASADREHRIWRVLTHGIFSCAAAGALAAAAQTAFRGRHTHLHCVVVVAQGQAAQCHPSRIQRIMKMRSLSMRSMLTVRG